MRKLIPLKSRVPHALVRADKAPVSPMLRKLNHLFLFFYGIIANYCYLCLPFMEKSIGGKLIKLNELQHR